MSVQYNYPSFKATENIPHTPGSSLSPFLPPNGSAVKPSPCVATHPGKPAIRRPRPNIPLCLARYLDPPNVRASLQACTSRPGTASGHSLLPLLPRRSALPRRHAPKPETALYHGRCTAPVRSCPHPPVLISCRQAHRRSPLGPDLDHTSVLHHLRSDIYETLSLLPHGIRQLVDEEVPSCVTSLSSSACTPFPHWPGPPALSGSPTSRSKCATSSGPPERYFCTSRTISTGKPATRIFPCSETTDKTGSKG